MPYAAKDHVESIKGAIRMLGLVLRHSDMSRPTAPATIDVQMTKNMASCSLRRKSIGLNGPSPFFEGNAHAPPNGVNRVYMRMLGHTSLYIAYKTGETKGSDTGAEHRIQL